jgi:hypothetical protein
VVVAEAAEVAVLAEVAEAAEVEQCPAVYEDYVPPNLLKMDDLVSAL